MNPHPFPHSPRRANAQAAARRPALPPLDAAGFTAAAATTADPGGAPLRHEIRIDGCAQPLVVERDGEGRLRTISAGGRVYVDARQPGELRFDGGFVVQRLVELPQGLLRQVVLQAAGAAPQRWTERYGWDVQGRLVAVDGTAIEHDAAGRVIACIDGESGAAWRYGYGGDRLSVIDTPFGLRQISHGDDGRPLAWREAAGAVVPLHYDAAGARHPGRTTPMHWERDATGRLLAVRDGQGRVRRCYLWDGWLCLAAIDGEPGAPLAEVYSLDPGGTPVRIAGRGGMRRIPRDAFGEGLLRACDPAAPHPGLFGGAIAGDGFVHLPWRRLDVRLGSFDRPDPLHGEAGDPRRAGGWQGPLMIELPAAGPYTVCRHNPVSLTDPTGAISDLWWLIPSALTWSMQNTVGSLLGMWLNLQFSPLGWIISKAIGADPFDAEWISAQNHDVFGLRSDGWISRFQPVAWTYQFLVNEEKASFTALEDARLFAPDAAFRPTLYGSLLRCAPASGPAFLLRGNRGGPNATPLADWSRCGGSAEAAFPGSLQPVFPAGGLHFDTVPRGTRAQAGNLVEVVPAPTMTTGIAGSFASLTVPGTGLGFAANADLLLEDGAGALDIVRVLDADDTPPNTLVKADPAPGRLAAGALRLRGLSAAAGTEALTPVAGEGRLLQIGGSSLDYLPGLSVLRLARGGAVVHVARVDGLQAQLALESPVPAGVGSDFQVRLAAASGSFDGRLGPTAAQYEVQSGSAPVVGAGILVGSGAAALPAIVQAAAGALLTLDRDLSALGAAGTAAPWQALAPGATLGRHAGAAEAGAVLTYVPAAAGAAPNSGFVWLQGAQAAVRRVAGRNHDALVMSAARPDAAPDAYDTTRWRLAGADIAGVTAGTVQTIALAAALPADASALHLLPFTGAAVSAGSELFTAATVQTLAAGTPPVVSATVAAGALRGTLRCGDVVVLTPAAGAPVAAVVRRLRLTVAFEQAPATGAGPLEAALLDADATAYAGELPDPTVPQRQVQLRVPVAGGLRRDMPRFVAGELVRVRYLDGAAARSGHYRIGAVAGLTLTLEGDLPLPVGAASIRVDRLQAIDARTGSARWGREGEAAGPGQLRFSVWTADAALAAPVLAIIDGASVLAAKVKADPQPLAIELAIAGDAAALAGPVRLAGPPGAGAGLVSAAFIVDQLTLSLPAATMVPPGQRVAVVPYVDSDRRSAGRLHAGSVRMPDDHENPATQLTRRQALEDHELSHTVQSARLGPLMLVAFPLWALELANDLTAAGGPAFGPYLAGTLAAGLVTPSNADGFEAGGKVQLAQNRRVLTVTLGAASGGGFRLGDGDRRSLATGGFVDGPVQLRRPLGGAGNDFLEWLVNLLELFTIGGLMNNLTLAGWGGVAALITQAVQGIRHAARSRVNTSLADDGVTLTLGADQSLDGLQQGVQVAVKKGDAIQLRAVAQFVGRTVVLAAPVTMRGEVELSVYAPGAALFGLRSFFPARAPDANQPARLQIDAAGGSTLALAVHDRVEVRTATGSAHRTLVTRVDGNAVELEEAVLLRDDVVNEFLIGKVGEEDPSGWLDSWLIDRAQIGWMQYLHDPWGQILYRAQPAAGNTAAQIFARSARYLFGTQSWMFCGLGFFWNDNAYQRDNPHRSLMEQEASRRSGDTYCPLGTLHGDVAVVGDVARYWVTVNGGSRDGSGNTPTDLIGFGLQDAAGVHLLQAPTIAAPAGTAFALPEALYALDGSGALGGIGARGFVPADAVLERSAGMHVVFSRPPGGGGSYTITAQALTGLNNSADAQSKGVATISFNRTPQDVTVRAAGVVVDEAPAAPVTLVPFQRLRFSVEPNGSRVWRITAGAEGRRFDSSGLDLTARGLLGADDAEISRFHHFDGTRYDSGIGPVHLPADLHVAVRRFAVEVVDVLPLRASLDHTAAPLPSLPPGGSGFVLVPAPLAGTPVQVQVAGALAVTAQVAAAVAPAGATRDFLGDGGAIQVTLPADQPPEATVRVTLRLQVGAAGAAPVGLRCEFDLVPAFTLDSAGGFSVARGGSITLRSSDARPIVAVALPAGVTAAPSGADLVVTVDAGHAVGPLTLRAADAADATRQARRIVQVT